MPIDSTTPPEAKVILGCARCGASLPDEAQFCLKCGKPVAISPKMPAAPEPVPFQLEPARSLRPLVVAILLAVVAAFALWAGMSDSPTAQDIQEFLGWKHDQVILDEALSVAPHSFRYFKFALPEGSVNVAVIGQFTSQEASSAGKRQAKGKAPEADDAIEAYVLTDAAFTVWQNGYATSSLYESGRATQGNVQAEIPAGAGIYYLVFSNKTAPKAAKSVHATVLLRYKSWLPEWFRHGKAKLLDWMGLN